MNGTYIPALPCMCASFRRASRVITQFYEEALRPHGLTTSQFTILQVLDLAGEVSQGRLGDMLAMDSTTLTRTLKIMLRHGWLTERRGQDRRERLLELAKAGRAQLKRVLPAWEKAQRRLAGQLGDERWRELERLTLDVTAIATKSGE